MMQAVCRDEIGCTLKMHVLQSREVAASSFYLAAMSSNRNRSRSSCRAFGARVRASVRGNVRTNKNNVSISPRTLEKQNKF